jgi:MoxR-like ATPase
MPEYVSATVTHIQNELRKVIVGQDEPIEQILVALLAEGHALIEGVPGTAKTLTVKTLSRILNAGFGRIQFTPDLMPSDITGTNVFNMANSTFNLRRGPCLPTLLLADEINRTPPKTQAALRSDGRKATIDGEGYALSPLFTVLD